MQRLRGGGAFLRGKAAGALRLTVQLHLLRMLAHTPSQPAQVNIYLFLYFTVVERVNVNWIKLALYPVSISVFVSQIVFIAAHPPLRRGGRKSWV
jgi:hypothetical protein